MSHAAKLSFSHVGIYVRDLDGMETFYADTLGMTVTDRGDLGPVRLVFLTTTPEEHHELVLASGRPGEVPFNVVNQISFRLDNLAALKALHARLVGLPADDIQPVTHGISWSVYCRDPEGNRLEFFVDAPWYVDQPMRVPIDLAMGEDDIMRGTEALCRDLPGFTTREAWQAGLARTLSTDRS